MKWVNLKLEYTVAQYDTEFVFNDYRDQFDLNSEMFEWETDSKSPYIQNINLYNKYSENISLGEGAVQRDYIHKWASSQYNILCPQCNEFTPAQIKYTDYQYCSDVLSSTHDSLESFYYINTWDSTTRMSIKPYYEFHCTQCDYSTSSYSSIISDFTEWLTIPKSVEQFKNNDIVSLKVTFERMKILNGKLTKLPYTCTLNFNAQSGRTNLVIRDSITKKKVRNVLNSKFFGCHVYHIVLYIQSLLDLDTLERLSISVAEYLKKCHKDVVERPRAYHIGDWTSTTATCHYTTGTSSTYNFDYNQDVKYTLYQLMIYNRYPKVSISDMESFIRQSVYYQNELKDDGYLIKAIMNMKNTDNPVKYVMDLFKIPNKKSIARTLYTGYITSVLNYPNISFYFKDINNISRLLHRLSIPLDLTYLRKWTRNQYTYKSPFLDLLFKKYTETQICNKIINHYSYYNDSIMLYDKILKAGHSIDIREIKGNLKEIHDYLSYRNDLIVSINLNLKERIRAEYLWLEKTLDSGYGFRFAEDTHELKTIGRKLKMCVGGYDDRAYEGRCHILVLEKSGKYVACIELSDDFKRVKQVKAKKNHLLEGDERDIVVSWIKANRLQLSTSDIEINNTIN